MKIYTIILSILLLTTSVSAQIRFTDQREIDEDMRYSAEKRFNTWALTVGYGSIFVYADISDYSIFPNHKIDFGPSIILSKQLYPSFAMDLQYIQGNLYGQTNSHYFRGDMRDISINGVLFINQLGAQPGPINDRWNYYLKLGAGLNFFRSRLHDSNTNEVIPHMVSGYDPRNVDEKIDRAVEVVVPFGAGLLYRINNHFDVGFESTMRFCSSDNLDNVLSGSSNDRYLFSSVNLSYKIGRKDKRHMRWTYRGIGFNLFGRPRKDMLRDEIKLLEEDLQNYVANRPVKKDSVIIEESLSILYETLTIRSIFFREGANNIFTNEDRVYMAEMAVQMKHFPEKTLELWGYVDPTDKGDHLAISLKQCEMIVDFMVNELGADRNRIKSIPKGSEASFEGQLSSSQITKMANRRVDLVFRR
jgi:hypothetical protein